MSVFESDFCQEFSGLRYTCPVPISLIQLANVSKEFAGR